MHSNPLLEVNPGPQAVVVKTDCDAFDMTQTERLKIEFRAIADQHCDLPVVFDMTGVDFMASMTLGALVELTGALKKNGQGFILTGVNSRIQEVMKSCALDRLFDIRGRVNDLVN